MVGKKQFPNGTMQYTFIKKGVLVRPLHRWVGETRMTAWTYFMVTTQT